MLAKKLLQGGSGSDFYPYTVDYACRFNDNDSPYLHRTPAGAGNQKIWTLSFWCKRANLGSIQYVMSAADSTWPPSPTYYFFSFGFMADDTFRFGGYSTQWLQTTQVFRDIGSWYHIVVSFDATQATSTNRAKLYVNGDEVTAFGTDNRASIANQNYPMNGTAIHTVGDIYTGSHNDYFDGYLSQVALIDGQQLTPSSFGEEKNGIWCPSDVSGLTFGTNGFLQDYANSAALGNDVSGNANDFTSSGLAANDQVTDTPTNKYATWNPLIGELASAGTPWPNRPHLPVYANGLLESDVTAYAAAGPSMIRFSSLPILAGMTVAAEFTNCDGIQVGIGGVAQNGSPGSGSQVDQVVCSSVGTTAAHQDATCTFTGTPLSFTTTDVIRVEADYDSSEVRWYKNGTLMVTATSVVIPFPGNKWYFTAGNNSSAANSSIDANFGQHAWDGTPTTDFVGLSAEAYPEPTLGPNSTENITDYFDVVLYEGTSLEQSITSLSFSPNLVAIKNRDAADSWMIFDTISGATNYVQFDGTAAEATGAQTLKSFDANGFTLGTDILCNQSGESYVAYCFKTHADFFDMVEYTGNQTARTIAHSMNVAPEFMNAKAHGFTGNWWVYAASLPVSDPETDHLYLDLDAVAQDDVTIWNDTAPTSSVFSLGTSAGHNRTGYINLIHLFASLDGMCEVGYIQGNGVADGRFIPLSFSPAFVLIKRTDVAGAWVVYDSAINTYNVVSAYLYADTNNAELGDGTTLALDFLSNGFKLRHSSSYFNADDGDYIFLAFAESPIKYSNAR